MVEVEANLTHIAMECKVIGVIVYVLCKLLRTSIRLNPKHDTKWYTPTNAMKNGKNNNAAGCDYVISVYLRVSTNCSVADVHQITRQ